jgi:putative transposase
MYLPTKVMGWWFYLHLTLDLYSHKIVGWKVHDADHSDHAAHLVRPTALVEGIGGRQANTTRPQRLYAEGYDSTVMLNW